jgi:photosystem II stability/assembly factor-like uncharacterized protein
MGKYFTFKKLILLELCLIFLATGFQGDNPSSGWYIQQIPVNKKISDIYFLDTLNGWVVTQRSFPNDTSYILKTSNGGTNWIINSTLLGNISLFSIQFTDMNIGYACGSTGGGTGKLYKTTNNGLNWNLILSGGNMFTDLWFINKDTGWVADNGHVPFGIGLLKTTNGGINWTTQLTNAYNPEKLFFLNKDTGWVLSDDDKLYRTVNSGNNWEFIIYFSSSWNFNNFFFTSIDTGWISIIGSNLNDLQKTTDGGHNWQVLSYPDSSTQNAYKIFMINSNYGYAGFSNNKIIKTTNGVTWKYQNGPINENGPNTVEYFKDSLHGWGIKYFSGIFKIIATTDGGGPILQIKNTNEQISKDYILYQNYPNPFNQCTMINVQLQIAKQVKIDLYDISGKLIKTLINKRESSGKHSYRIDAGNLSTGVYFYTLFIDGNRIDTKKMLLIK